MMNISKKEWIFDQHRNTNHFYAGYLPYEYHLKLAYTFFDSFKHLLEHEYDMLMGKEWTPNYRKNEEMVSERDACELAVLGHDLIEDTRVTYNDVSNILGRHAAEIIYAVTNEKGKNRKERANTKYYQEMRKVPGAVFVKLCDRLANVTHGKIFKSSMIHKYKDEHKHFCKMLGRYTEYSKYEEMFLSIDKLFENDLT